MGAMQDGFELEVGRALFGLASGDITYLWPWWDHPDVLGRMELWTGWGGDLLLTLVFNEHTVPGTPPVWTFLEDDTDYIAQLSYGIASKTPASGGSWDTYNERSQNPTLFRMFVYIPDPNPEEPHIWEMETFWGWSEPPVSRWGPKLVKARDLFATITIPKVGGIQRLLAEWILRCGTGQAATGGTSRWRWDNNLLIGNGCLELLRGHPSKGGTPPSGGAYQGLFLEEYDAARRADGMWLLLDDALWPVPTADWGAISHIGWYDRRYTQPNPKLMLVAPLNKVVQATAGVQAIIPSGYFTWQVA